MKALPSISKLQRANVECPTCLGEGWVCETHPDRAWGDGLACCGGAGALCRCNFILWRMENPDEGSQ